MDSLRILDRIRSQPDYDAQMVHVEDLPAADARLAPIPEQLHSRLHEYLQASGIAQLYSHQAQAFTTALAREHMVVVTPTASGKTLCYNLPVLNDLLQNPEATALYIFPTKALTQDQWGTLIEMAPGLKTFIYDGDTVDAQKQEARATAQIILTNPDMLHQGILPNHLKWHRFFSGLRYVVIDEIHSYRGVFGTHVGHVLRRLQRLCRYYGASPQFVMCSATIGNPGEHSETLTGLPVRVIDENGAPRGACRFVIWKQSPRISLVQETAWLFSHLIRQDARTIAFSRARQSTERTLRQIRRHLQSTPYRDKVLTYRGGYLPAERRQVEHQLFSGQARGVIATNALELGIDVGDLEACIIAGFPGTIASTWQQAGRVGRRREESLVVFLAVNNPLDQYFVRHTEALFKKPSERALTDPDNPYILLNHAVCAAHELPVCPEEETGWGPVLKDLLAILAEDGVLALSDGTYYYAGQGYPAERFSIRSASSETFQLRDAARPRRLIGMMDGSTAFSEVHDGAVYMHQGDTYVVQKLDLDNRIAYLQETDVDYYTLVRRDKTTEILETERQKDFYECQVATGPLRVTTQVTGYLKKHEVGGQVLGSGNLDLPEQILETVGTWLMVPDSIGLRIREAGLDLMGSLHAVEHAAIGLLPLFVMCDRNDIGGLSTVKHAQTKTGTIFIHDAYHGGVGFSETAYTQIEMLLDATREAIMACSCEDGCPSCIHSAKCSNFNQPLDKEGAIYLLHLLLNKPYTVQKKASGKEQNHQTAALRRAAGRFKKGGDQP